MPRSELRSLWYALKVNRNLSGHGLWGADGTVRYDELFHGSCLGGRTNELRGRSVLVATTSQLAAGLALIELDGIARRLVLYPSDLPLEHIPFVMASAEVDAVVSDRTAAETDSFAKGCFVACTPGIVSGSYDRSATAQTEWILLTSGTTGLPKLVVHTLSSLAGAIEEKGQLSDAAVWSTFYDIRRYGGLQIFLRAVLGGSSLVLSSAQESTADFLTRAGGRQITHISGTPSHWRRALMSPSANHIAPRYVRLSGEIVDQGILDHLRSFYPQAGIAHAFASTEAGVAFDVPDGCAGFPASLIKQGIGEVDLKVENGSLRIRSNRTAAQYLGDFILKDADGFVDTSDMLELRGERYYFVGRRDGVINVGGLKVHPEEVEAVINSHPQVQMSLVRARKNPLSGALVVADVVLKADSGPGQASASKQQILQFCRQALPSHKVPTTINFVPALAVSETGKLMRLHA
jgi:acyl-coenzyme A synthetase/AMP-(fatty) acid ligase